MTTTALIVEMLVIGIFSLCWICLLLFRIPILDITTVTESMKSLKDWVPIITVIALGVTYQLGWMINSLSYAITEILGRGSKIRKKLFEDASLEYEDVRALVYQEASTDARADLGVDRSVVRLARAATVNFAIIAIVLGSFLGKYIFIGIILLLCSIICYLQWYFRFKRYYRRMLKTYEQIINFENE